MIQKYSGITKQKKSMARLHGVVSFWLYMIIVLCLIVIQCDSAFAQDDKPPSPGGNLEIFNPILPMQLKVIIVVVGAWVFYFGCQIYLLRKVTNLTSDDIIRNCSISSVIVFAAILIVAGYNSEQTAQAFGLFGTIIGYMLGKSSNQNNSRNQTEEK